MLLLLFPGTTYLQGVFKEQWLTWCSDSAWKTVVKNSHVDGLSDLINMQLYIIIFQQQCSANDQKSYLPYEKEWMPFYVQKVDRHMYLRNPCFLFNSSLNSNI